MELVAGILDDLIVPGPNGKELLRNLGSTLKRLDSSFAFWESFRFEEYNNMITFSLSVLQN